jgi:SNF2 family DNA or RNA helicase
LIVAPLSVLSAWVKELAFENVSETASVLIRGSRSKRITRAREPCSSGFYLVNYEGLRVTPELARIPWTGLVLDESTTIRNPKAKITKRLLRTFEHVPLRAILTGYPAPESLLDYYCQFAFKNNGPFMGCKNYWDFRRKFFIQLDEVAEWDWIPKSETRTKIMRRVRSEAFVMTRKQAGIGTRKVYETREVAMSPEQAKIYNQLLRSFEYKYKKEHVSTKWILVQVNWLGQIAGGFEPRTKNCIGQGKIRELHNLLSTELFAEQVVVWFRYNKELFAAKKALAEFKPAHIVGKTPPEIRTKRIDEFQSGERRILLCQARCTRLGLDFSAASTAIYFSNYYDLEVRVQSEDRIVHPKKSEPLLYVDLISKRTVDEPIVNLLQEKKVEASLVFKTFLKAWRASKQ